MQINSISTLPTILDYLDDDKNDNSIEAVLTSNSRYQTAMIRRKLGLDDDTDNSSRSSGAILTSAQSAADTLDKMLSKSEDSIFAEATEDSSETALTDVITQVQSFISSYNTLVKNMSASGGRTNVTYLVELGKSYVDNEDELNELGITRNDNGQLTADTGKLKAADADKLKAVFNGSDGYAAGISGTIANIIKVTTATSSMQGLQGLNYSSSASVTDMAPSLTDSLFNSKA